MLRIGELASQAGLTVRTLHHYDAIGLLRPSARTGGGYRLYDEADIARLHAIQALRQLGLSLDEVGRLLADGGTSLPIIVEQQLRALDRQIAQATELRARLQLLQAKVNSGDTPAGGEWLGALRLMTTCDKYFSTEELKKIFGNWHRISAEWPRLLADVRATMDAGVPADALSVQPLAYRWMALMGVWLDGDFDLIRRWGEMYRREPSVQRSGPGLDLLAFVEQAVQLRLQAYGRHLSLEQLKRLALVPPTDWAPLKARVLALQAQGVSPASEAGQAVKDDWLALMDRTCCGDPALRTAVIHAFRVEPVLSAGAVMGAQVHGFLRAALDAALAPVVA